MNEYTEQALSFLRNNNVKLRIKKSDVQQPAPWASGPTGYKYDCVLSTTRGAYYFPFWDSLDHRQKDATPGKYDVLACLDVYDGSIDDFTDDFGLSDQATSKTIETYNAVIDQSLQLRHILPAKALRELEEIN